MAQSHVPCVNWSHTRPNAIATRSEWAFPGGYLSNPSLMMNVEAVVQADSEETSWLILSDGRLKNHWLLTTLPRCCTGRVPLEQKVQTLIAKKSRLHGRLTRLRNGPHSTAPEMRDDEIVRRHARPAVRHLLIMISSHGIQSMFI